MLPVLVVVCGEGANAESDAPWCCVRIDCCCSLVVSEVMDEFIFWPGTFARDEDSVDDDSGTRWAKLET